MRERSAPIVDLLDAWIRARDRVDADRPIPITFAVAVPWAARIGLGAAFLALSSVYIAIWLRPYGGFAAARAAMALIVVGVALLLGPRLIRQGMLLPAGDRPPGSPWLLALGCSNNLAVAQLVAVLAMIAFAARREIDAAWWAAAITVLLVVPLYRSKASAASAAMAAAGILYLAYSIAVGDIGRVIAANAYARELPGSVIPLGAILWTGAAIALVPQVQLVRVGGLGIGCLRGDTGYRLFGSTIPVAFTSSVLLVSLFGAIPALFYLPGSIRMASGN